MAVAKPTRIAAARVSNNTAGAALRSDGVSPRTCSQTQAAINIVEKERDMPKLKTGDKVPDFIINDLEDRPHRLYDYLNGQKTVLLFYRGEWCPVCNLQLHSLQERLAEFQKENALILAISTDTPENSQKLVGKHNLGFPVLAGLSREAAKSYDLFFSEEKGYAEPAVFILHHNGTVAYASLQSGPLGRPSNDDLLRIVSRIQVA